jgi:hypothetical protein
LIGYTVAPPPPPENRFSVSRILHRPGGRISFTIRLRQPGPGTVDAVVMAASNAFSIRRQRHAGQRFVFARRHLSARHLSVVGIQLQPDARGRLLLAHHRYPVVVSVRVTYTPAGGRSRSTSYSLTLAP